MRFRENTVNGEDPLQGEIKSSFVIGPSVLVNEGFGNEVDGNILYDTNHLTHRDKRSAIPSRRSGVTAITDLSEGPEFGLQDIDENTGKIMDNLAARTGNDIFTASSNPGVGGIEPRKPGIAELIHDVIGRKKSSPSPDGKNNKSGGFRKNFLFRRSSLPDHMLWAREKLRTMSPTRRCSSSAPESPNVGAADIFNFDNREQKFHLFSLSLKRRNKTKDEAQSPPRPASVSPQEHITRHEASAERTFDEIAECNARTADDTLYEIGSLESVSELSIGNTVADSNFSINSAHKNSSLQPPSSNLLKRRREKKGSLTSLNSQSSTNSTLSLQPGDSQQNLRATPDTQTFERVEGGKKSSRSPAFRKRLAQKFRFSYQSNEALLQAAIAHQDHETLEKLLDTENAYININFIYPSGGTVLHQAIIIGDISAVKLLVKKGADVELKTSSDVSPTLLAAQCGHFEIAQFLIMAGANVEDVQNGHQRI